jgi:hypothetical protein
MKPEPAVSTTAVEVKKVGDCEEVRQVGTCQRSRHVPAAAAAPGRGCCGGDAMVVMPRQWSGQRENRAGPTERAGNASGTAASGGNRRAPAGTIVMTPADGGVSSCKREKHRRHCRDESRRWRQQLQA